MTYITEVKDFTGKLQDVWQKAVKQNPDVHPMTTLFNLIDAYDDAKGVDFKNYVGFQCVLTASIQLYEQIRAHGHSYDDFIQIVEAQLTDERTP